MDVGTVERLDHGGSMAGVITDVGSIERSAARMVPDDQEALTTGAAVAGMRLTGLGFSDRPMALPPPFFAHTPVAFLVRDGVSAEHGHRCTLGRSLDTVPSYGCDVWCRAGARAVCKQAGMALRCTSLDTTRCALTGASGPETDTQAMAITHGYSKDHRPDLKHVVWALMVSQDGGVPVRSQRGDGQASDTVVCKARGEALSAPFEARETPRYLIADAT